MKPIFLRNCSFGFFHGNRYWSRTIFMKFEKKFVLIFCKKVSTLRRTQRMLSLLICLDNQMTFLRTYRLDFFYHSIYRQTQSYTCAWICSWKKTLLGFCSRILTPRRLQVLLLILFHLHIQNYFSPSRVAGFLQPTYTQEFYAFGRGVVRIISHFVNWIKILIARKQKCVVGDESRWSSK